MRKTKILSVFLMFTLLFPSYIVFAEEGDVGNTATKSEPEVYNTYYQKTTADDDDSTPKNDPAKEETTTQKEPKKEETTLGPTVSTQSEVEEGEHSVESKQNDMQQPWWAFVIAAVAVLVLAQFINFNQKAKA